MLGVLFVCYSARGHQLVFTYPSSPEAPPDTFLGFECSFLSDVLSPKLALCDKQFMLSIDNVDFIGHPTLLHADRPGTGLRFTRLIQRRKLDTLQSNADQDAKSATHQITMFHLVFALHPSTGSFASDMYDQVITKATAAFKYEQLRRGYIRKETELILSIKEQCASNDPQSTLTRLLGESSLAFCLANIYDTVVEKGNSIVDVNESISLAFRALDLSFGGRQSDSSSIASPSLPSPDSALLEPFRPSLLRPYCALLLLSDAEELLKLVPVDSSPLLVELIQIVTPTQSFEEIQMTLGCSIPHIYRLVAHLLFWRKAIVISAISTRNVYTISPKGDLSKLKQNHSTITEFLLIGS